MTYTVTISNTGKAPAWDVKVIDTYPVSTTFKAAQPPPDVGDNEWHLGNLLPDQTRSISTTLLVDSKVVSGTVLINTVTAQSEWTAPVVVTDTVVVHERCIPLASATLDGPGTVEVGQSGVFKVNYTPGNATSPISYAWSADGLTGGRARQPRRTAGPHQEPKPSKCRRATRGRREGRSRAQSDRLCAV